MAEWSSQEILAALGLLVVMLVILFLWFGPGKALIAAIASRGGRLQTAQLQVEIPPVVAPTAGTVRPEEPPPTDPKTTTSVLPEPEAPEPTFEALEKAIKEGRLEIAKKIREGLESELQEPERRFMVAIHYEYWLANYGQDPTAFARLKVLADENQANPFVQAYVAFQFEAAGNLDDAAAYWDRALKVAGDARAALVKDHARWLARSKGKDAAIKSLLAEAASDEENAADFLALAAKMLKESGDKETAAMALLVALSKNPGLVESTFEIGYDLADSEWKEAAVVAYTTYTQSFPKDTSGMNNLGLLLSELGAETVGYNLLRKAANEGGSSGAANLARALGTQGFSEESKAWLERAKAVDATDPRVGSTEEQTKNKAEADRARAAELRELGGKMMVVFRSYFARTLAPQPTVPPSASKWKDQKGSEWEIAVSGDQVTITYGGYAAPGKRATGVLKGGTARLTFENQEWRSEEKGFVWVESGRGYIVFAADGRSAELVAKHRWRPRDRFSDYTGCWSLQAAA